MKWGDRKSYLELHRQMLEQQDRKDMAIRRGFKTFLVKQQTILLLTLVLVCPKEKLDKALSSKSGSKMEEEGQSM